MYNLDLLYGWREGGSVLHRYACTISSHCMEISMEGWKVGRLGGWRDGGLGGWRDDAGNGQSERGRRKMRKRCDDRAEDAVFVHASEGKLITRWSLAPLKC